jgi:hypothetical protein
MDASFAKAALFFIGLISLLVVGWSIKNVLRDETKDHKSTDKGNAKVTWAMLLIGSGMILYGLFILLANP